MEPREWAHHWRREAAEAGFVFYRPVHPEPDALWAGGRGGHNGALSHLGIKASVNGAEVSVDTRLQDEHAPPDVQIRFRLGDLIWHDLFDDDTVLEFPLTLRIDAESRVIEVDGEPTDFDGLRLGGSPKWTGTAIIGDTSITVTTADPATVTAIAPATADDITDLPPGYPTE